MITKIKLIGVWLLALTVCLVTVSAHAGPGASSSPYRLNLSAEQFQFGKPSPSASASAMEPAIPPLLRDKPYAELINRAALRAELEPALVHAVIFVESRYNQAARSPKGAIGLMQLMPDTASRYGVRDPARSPEANLRAGTFYLRHLIRQFGDRLDLVLAAYNAGENAVVRYGHRIPPYAETRAYVPAVLAKYSEWREPRDSVPSVALIDYMPGTRLDSQYSEHIAQ